MQVGDPLVTCQYLPILRSLQPSRSFPNSIVLRNLLYRCRLLRSRPSDTCRKGNTLAGAGIMDDSSSSHDPRRRLSTPQQHRTVGPHDRHDPPGYSTPSLAPASSLTFSPSHRPRVARIDSTDRKRRLTAGEHGRTYPYVAPGSSRADPLDLTQISPPWPNRGQNAEGGASMYPVRRESRIPDREVMPPRWEPDSTVSKCPVCETDFGLFFRKHHCRKCGRVVCGMCSPHRITIPREYIVQPPTAYDTIPRTPGGAEVVSLLANDACSVA